MDISIPEGFPCPILPGRGYDSAQSILSEVKELEQGVSVPPLPTRDLSLFLGAAARGQGVGVGEAISLPSFDL